MQIGMRKQEALSAQTLSHHLYGAMALNALILATEFTVGILIHSVGLMTDAWHNTIDQGSLFLTFYAHLLGSRPATSNRTFGYQRAGVLVAFVNTLVLIAAASAMAWMAVRRLMAPTHVLGIWVMMTSLLSFGANMGIALLLKRGAERDLNFRGAFWHMLGDAWVCFGVAASGLIIWKTQWYFLDPLISLVIVSVIIKGAWPVLRESMHVLMESAPSNIVLADVISTIEHIPGVDNVHDVHLWEIKAGLTMLTCHVMTKAPLVAGENNLVSAIRSRVMSTFGIKHITVQTETRCCHSNAVHCNLENLVEEHRSLLQTGA